MGTIEFKSMEPEFAVTEAMNTLRTNIIYSNEIKIINITSTFPNEGKSTIAIQLARSFAELGKKTLLIDCDLRKSSLIHRFHGDRKLEGLSELLTGQSVKIIHSTDIDNLSVICSGQIPPNPSELLSGQKFTVFIQALKEKYDYIIMDSPPIGSVIDAAIVGRNSDGTLMVVRNDFSTKAAVKRAKQQLEQSGCKLLGVILNRVKKHQKDYYYYSGYYKYGYGEEK